MGETDFDGVGDVEFPSDIAASSAPKKRENLISKPVAKRKLMIIINQLSKN